MDLGTINYQLYLIQHPDQIFDTRTTYGKSKQLYIPNGKDFTPFSLGIELITFLLSKLRT